MSLQRPRKKKVVRTILIVEDLLVPPSWDATGGETSSSFRSCFRLANVQGVDKLVCEIVRRRRREETGSLFCYGNQQAQNSRRKQSLRNCNSYCSIDCLGVAGTSRREKIKLTTDTVFSVMMKAGGKDCEIKCSSARHVAQCEEHP